MQLRIGTSKVNAQLRSFPCDMATWGRVCSRLQSILDVFSGRCLLKFNYWATPPTAARPWGLGGGAIPQWLGPSRGSISDLLAHCSTFPSCTMKYCVCGLWESSFVFTGHIFASFNHSLPTYLLLHALSHGRPRGSGSRLVRVWGRDCAMPQLSLGSSLGFVSQLMSITCWGRR